MASIRFPPKVDPAIYHRFFWHSKWPPGLSIVNFISGETQGKVSTNSQIKKTIIMRQPLFFGCCKEFIPVCWPAHRPWIGSTVHTTCLFFRCRQAPAICSRRDWHVFGSKALHARPKELLHYTAQSRMKDMRRQWTVKKEMRAQQHARQATYLSGLGLILWYGQMVLSSCCWC